MIKSRSRVVEARRPNHAPATGVPGRDGSPQPSAIEALSVGSRTLSVDVGSPSGFRSGPRTDYDYDYDYDYEHEHEHD